MNRTETRFLETAASPQAIEEIQTALERAWSIHSEVPDTVRMHMGIAAGEIGANIVEHAAPHRPVRMCMDVDILPGRVRVEFTDDGDPAHIDLSAVCMPDDMAERGRGLALARAVLEELSYRRAESNHWTLLSNRFF